LLFSVQSNPLFEFGLPLESYPARPSQSCRSGSAPLLGSGSLQHMKDRWSTHAGSPTRYVPPSGFGYPPGGLLPSIPCRFFFAPAALLGFTLRSVLLSKGVPVHYHPDGPTYRFAHRCSRRRSDGPAQRAAVPGLQPFRESLAAGQRVSLPAAGCSLGFCPFQGSPPKASFEISLKRLSRASSAGRRVVWHTSAPEYRSTFDRLYPTCCSKLQPPDRATLLGFLHRLNPVVCGRRVPRAMRSPLIVSCITAD